MKVMSKEEFREAMLEVQRKRELKRQKEFDDYQYVKITGIRERNRRRKRK